ncbi:MAG: M48 family metallopeptidase [Candidatus Aminicenantes bacterium]|nr:MAG: M48 family metallopeptidase [Candidatus Aminicenantes bacterium]
MNLYLVIILAVLVGKYLLGVIADRLNIKHLNPELPDEFKGFYDERKYAKSQRYARENSKFGLIHSTITIAIIIPFILLGGFNTIDKVARAAGYGPIVTGLVFLGILALLAGMIELPFAVYDNFVIEEKYGFNKTTVKTFIMDIVKSLLLSIIIGAPLFALIIWFFRETGKLAPLYIWIIVTLFQLFMMLIAPTVILPLFNKFTPLEEGELKDTLEKYARENNFHLKGIYKMDESKRSTKPNAIFTGFGKSRRIVLFDTLIENYTGDELLAALAHEMGHYKLKHMPKMVAAAILETGLIFFTLSLFINNKGLFAAFKMENLSIYASLIFFGFLYSPISTIISIVMNIFSRKREYEADQFAVETTGKREELITALKKLSRDTLSNLTPHPFKVFLYDSHPPVLQRIRAIKT